MYVHEYLTVLGFPGRALTQSLVIVSANFVVGNFQKGIAKSFKESDRVKNVYIKETV